MTLKVSGECEERIIEQYRAGVPVETIGAEHGVDKVTVYNVLRRNEVPRRRRAGPRRKVIAPEVVEQIVALRREGWAKIRLADEFGIGQPRLTELLAAAGCDIAKVRRRDAKERVEHSGGYRQVWVPDDDLLCVPMRKSSSKYVMEHRVVMAHHLGRALLDTETVHHINGDKTDNQIENLQLRQGAHGKGVHARCLDCGSTNVEGCSI